jgi:hypothetical protein
MRRVFWGISILVIASALVVMSIPSEAAKPQKEVNGQTVYVGNGYPSGPHYNLHFLGKWLRTFECPTKEEYELETPDKNVIYVPRDPNMDIKVLVESGKKGPKTSVDPKVFEVTDWCSKDFGGNDAMLRLPMDPLGFLAYARITGKPLDESGNSFTADVGGCLKYAEDFAGNDLILLGLVTSSGTYVPTCNDTNDPGDDTVPLLMRTNRPNGKGVNKAIPITDIFLWSGDACNIVATVGESTDVYCCVDADSSGDGVYEHCDPLLALGGGACSDHTYTGDINGTLGTWNYTTVYASCTTYTDYWIFNIADFIDYMWDIDSSGAYNINVRFYPCSELAPGTCGEPGI